MKARKTADQHSDLGPSSKDWQPGGPGRKADFAPGNDLRRKSHAENEVQPGTAHEGKSWQSRRPDPDDKQEQLDKALEDSFPASDPPAPAHPDVTGWDVDDEAVKRAGGTRPSGPPIVDRRTPD
jgi:hypothetical protein